MSRPLAHVVVVLYHSLPVADTEVRGLVGLADRDPRVRWTFVDNSEDGHDATTLEPLVSRRPNVGVVRRPDNPGFATACNAVGLATDAEWLVLLNPDLLVPPEAFTAMTSALATADGSTQAVAFSQRTGALHHVGVAFGLAGWFMDRPVPVPAGVGRGRPTGLRERVYRLAGGGGRLIGPSGGAAAYRASAFRAHGGLHDAYFAWGEDADLALRLSLAGARTEALELGLRHQGGHSVTGAGVRRRAELLARNRVLLAARLYSLPQALLFGAFLAGVLVLKVPAMVAARTLAANLRGVAAGVRGARAARRAHPGPRLRVRDTWAGRPGPAPVEPLVDARVATAVPAAGRRP